MSSFAQQSQPPELTPAEAKQLAKLMCQQLPNVATIVSTLTVTLPPSAPQPALEEPIVMDDVYDALQALGPYSVPCLTERLLDTGWMPDPRSEPLMGAPVVGDVAYMALGEKGVPDFIAGLAHKKTNDMTMGDYLYCQPSAITASAFIVPSALGWQNTRTAVVPYRLCGKVRRRE